jgi:glutathione peroxidase
MVVLSFWLFLSFNYFHMNTSIKLTLVIFSGIALVFILSGFSNPFRSVGTTSIYDFQLKTLEGDSTSLAKYKGKKMLIVNVASECGYTPQYTNLEALYKKYSDKLVVIGFPANNFGAQEPGSATEIRQFCTKNYGVTFPIMAKISVKGDDMHPLYKWLSTKEENGTCNDAPKWNFCKYLIDENGKIIKYFGSKVDPLSEEITSLL